LKIKFFLVKKVSFCGGSNSTHDPWPDGHYVEAESFPINKYNLSFYQSGCFNGLLFPKDIVLVKGASNLIEAKIQIPDDDNLFLDKLKDFLRTQKAEIKDLKVGE